MSDAFEIGIKELQKDPFFFLKTKPVFMKEFNPLN